VAIKIIRTSGEEIIIKDGATANEEYGKLTIFNGTAMIVARFQSEEVAEWWVVENGEQDSDASP
jgi:hypothetical protein